MKKPVMQANQRGTARLAAVQALYQMDVGGQTLEDTLAEFETHRLGRELEGDEYLPADAAFFRLIVRGVVEHQIELDPVIDGALTPSWPMTRIDATLRALLRAGAFELVRRRDIPYKVVIAEYVDVARAFYDDDVPGLTTAVLDNIARRHARDYVENRSA